MEIKKQQQGLLPTYAYTSQEWFDKEARDLWGKNWFFAGMVTDLPEPGDYMTVQVGVHPIFIVRGRDHRLRAFHNICRHRGTQLLRAKGKSDKNIVCPYHSWTYTLNGDLMNIPDEDTQFAGQNIDKGQLCLHGASIETWREMIFVHPDPNPQPFMDYLGDVPKHIGPHKVEELVEYDGTTTVHEANANWKIIIENAIDGYHLSYLHEDTLNMYNHKKQEWDYVNNHWVFWEPMAEWYHNDVRNLAPFGVIDHVLETDPEEKWGAYLYHLFPSVLVTETEGSWSTFVVTPLAPDKSIITVRSRIQKTSMFKYAAQMAKSMWHWNKYSRKTDQKYDANDPLQSGDFMAEDIYACEQQQKAMNSPMYAQGPASHDEGSILGFHKAITQFCPVKQ